MPEKVVVSRRIWDRTSDIMCRCNGVCVDRSEIWKGKELLALAADCCRCRFRVMGAGDGKLMAVIGGYLGPLPGFYAIALGFLTGAVWSLWRMKRYGVAAERFNYMKRYVEMVTASRNIISRLQFAWRPVCWGICSFPGVVLG